MEQCPRCGAAVSPFAPACGQCGLPRHDRQAPMYSAPPTRPRRNGAVLMMAGLIAVLVLALAAGAGLWLTDTGPFAPNAGGSPPGLDQPVVTITSAAATPSPSTAAPTESSESPEPTESTTQATAPTAPTAATAATELTPPTTSAPPRDFSEVYPDVESGVGQIVVLTCLSGYTGTGFLVDDQTMVTAAHVIEGAVRVAVDFDGSRVGTSVIGVEPSLDLALLHLDQPVSGRHAFTLASDDPQPGTHIAVIGYPLGEPKSLSEGTISGLDRTIRTETGTYFGLLQTDAAINPGNSGGPLLDNRGQVVGLADAIRRDAQGIGYAVPVSQIGPAIDTTARLAQPPTPGCLDPQGPQPPIDPTDSVERGVRQALRSYLGAINARDYDEAMSWLSPAVRADSTREQWQDDYATTYDDQLEIRSVSGSGSQPHVWATFRSQQSAGDGPAGARDATCLIWSIDYDFQQQSDRWVIVAGDGHDDPPWTRCD